MSAPRFVVARTRGLNDVAWGASATYTEFLVERMKGEATVDREAWPPHDRWTTSVAKATKYKTVMDAFAAAIVRDATVVKYNPDNRSWSRLTDSDVAP